MRRNLKLKKPYDYEIISMVNEELYRRLLLEENNSLNKKLERFYVCTFLSIFAVAILMMLLYSWLKYIQPLL